MNELRQIARENMEELYQRVLEKKAILTQQVAAFWKVYFFHVIFFSALTVALLLDVVHFYWAWQGGWLR